MWKCIPKCGGKKDSSSSKAPVQLDSEHSLVCGQCKTSQSVSRDSSVFVCLNCHAVNRVGVTVDTPSAEPGTAPEPQAGLVDIPEENAETITLRRVNSSTFVDVNSASMPPLDSKEGPVVIGPCSVCMDGAGDMIFQKCNHGGFCEACARHIAQNMAVGGAHCPRCREAITQVVRIVQIDNNNIIKAVHVSVQTASDSKAPPKVPPPRGFNKAKKR